MIIKEFKRLSALRIQQLKTLEALCLENDGALCPVFCEPGLNFTSDLPAFFFATVGNRTIGALSLFLPGDDTAEISALVAPAHRGKGIFKALLQHAKETLKALEIREVFIVSVPGIEACDAVLKELKAEYLSSEYKMYLPAPSQNSQKSLKNTELVPAAAKDIPLISDMYSDFFGLDKEGAATWLESVFSMGASFYKLNSNGKTVGCGGFVSKGESSSVFGVGVVKEHRGKGLGRFLLESLMQKMPTDRSVVLQVSDKNAEAFGLYQKLGFAIVSTVRYHSLKLEIIP